MEASPQSGQRAVEAPPDRAERDRAIALAAYFRAEKRGFVAGSEVDDWLEAEREVARQLDR